MTATHTWSPRDLWAVPKEPLRPEIGGLLTPGCITLMSGEPEAGKTNVCIALAVEEIRRGEAVIWVDLEMGLPQLVSRCADFGLSGEELTQLVVVAPEEPLRAGSEIAADVDALVAGVRPSLVVFDAMTGLLELHGLNANDGVQVEQLYRTVIDRFRAHGAAVVVLDHLTKDRENRGRWAIGSERKVGRADVHLGIECAKPFSRGRDGLVRIRVHKDRLGTLARPYAGELALRSGANGAIEFQLHTSTDTAAPDVEWWPYGYAERVSRYLESAGEPQSRNKIEKAVGGKSSHIRKAIDGLLAGEYAVGVPGGPGGAALVESRVPYRESYGATSAAEVIQAEVERLAAEHEEEVEA